MSRLAGSVTVSSIAFNSSCASLHRKVPSQASAESMVVDATDLLDRSFLVFLVELKDRTNDLLLFIEMKITLLS
uniref:Uncharacterized protein n=1 Tax=Ixodes ricinus TaxID=34613 RepID=A0A6B0U1P2_IXORI